VPDPGDGVIRAAGAVVWRSGPAGLQIVLVHRPRYDDWSLPKGKSERGEHILLTATREVAEETGLRVVLGRPLSPSAYEVNGRPKRVSYWAARCVESLGFVGGDEVDELAWLDLPRVPQRLSYERDRRLIAEFASGPVSTIPFILLRHAEAGSRSPDSAVDLARPLDHRGSAAAKLLATLLASYGRCRVICSAADRCVATVRPYADAMGVDVETEPAFTVAGLPQLDGDMVARASNRVAELAADGQPTLICAHRENLPTLLGAAGAAFGAGEGLAAEPPLGKGSFLALQCAAGALASCERHDLIDLAARGSKNVVAMR
jgi:8-oxo-(d)GTP phosphatase